MRILVIRYDCMGDVLVGTSVLPGLKAKYPGAEIHFHARYPFSTMLYHHPLIDAIVEHEPDRSRYDLVFYLDHDPEWNGSKHPTKTMVRAHCDICGVPEHSPNIFFRPEEIEEAKPFEGCIAVGHWAGWRSRMYASMAEVCEQLIAEGLPLVQVDSGAAVCAQMPKPTNPSVRHACAIVNASSLYFGIDTLFMHVAVACGKRMVVPMGPTGRENQYLPPSAVVIRTKHFTNVWDEEYAGGIKIDPEVVLTAVRYAYETAAV